MASRRPPRPPQAAPIPQFQDAEKTEISFSPPELDLGEEPTEDTDKNAIPENAKKLRLPLPFEEEPPASSAPSPPPPKKMSPLNRIKLLRVQPEKSSSRLILG